MVHTLYLSKHGSESAFDHTNGENVVETYEATRARRNSSLFLGRIQDRYDDGREFQNVYSIETGFSGKLELRDVGTLNHTEKKYSNTFGYFEPHPTGKKLARYAKHLGYSRF